MYRSVQRFSPGHDPACSGGKSTRRGRPLSPLYWMVECQCLRQTRRLLWKGPAWIQRRIRPSLLSALRPPPWKRRAPTATAALGRTGLPGQSRGPEQADGDIVIELFMNPSTYKSRARLYPDPFLISPQVGHYMTKHHLIPIWWPKAINGSLYQGCDHRATRLSER